MGRPHKDGSQETEQHDERKKLWKKALQNRVATVEEIRRCAVDPESQELLMMSLRLVGIRITQ